MKFKDINDHFYNPPEIDLMNTFDVEEHENKNHTVDTFFNLNISCGIVGVEDVPESLITYYTVKENDHLKIISYNLYHTIDFWWLIAKINNIDDVLAPIEPGTKLKTFSSATMGAIYSEILKLSKRNKDSD